MKKLLIASLIFASIVSGLVWHYFYRYPWHAYAYSAQNLWSLPGDYGSGKDCLSEIKNKYPPGTLVKEKPALGFVCVAFCNDLDPMFNQDGDAGISDLICESRIDGKF